MIGRAVANDFAVLQPAAGHHRGEIDEMLDRVGKALDELTVQLRREQIAVVS